MEEGGMTAKRKVSNWECLHRGRSAWREVIIEECQHGERGMAAKRKVS